jgi:DNA-binding transcriptional ArsR family regulator
MTTMNEGSSVSAQDLGRLTALFRLLSDKTRLNVLMLLAHGERNVSSLCEELGVSQPTVSHHLGLLRMNNVIGSRRAGKQIFYGLNGRIGVNDGGAALEIGLGGYTVTIQGRPAD